jgi:hypothetical protein
MWTDLNLFHDASHELTTQSVASIRKFCMISDSAMTRMAQTGMQIHPNWNQAITPNLSPYTARGHVVSRPVFVRLTQTAIYRATWEN